MFTIRSLGSYKYAALILAGAVCGVLQGQHNSTGESFDFFLNMEVPLIAYIFLGVVALSGVFIRPPNTHKNFAAFASSLIVFSGATSLVYFFVFDLHEMIGIMSAAAIGIGSGTLYVSVAKALSALRQNET